jgi:hypothetical protein
MLDEAMRRLLDFDRRRYWLSNGWSIRFRITEVEATEGRPHGIKYAFTLHDVDRTRLLGFDNAHGIPLHRSMITGIVSDVQRTWWPTIFEAQTN